MINQDSLITIKIVSGIYFLYDNEGLVYIGQSKNIHSRVTEHLRAKKFDFSYYTFVEKPVKKLKTCETRYIRNLDPPCNLYFPNPLFVDKEKERKKLIKREYKDGNIKEFLRREKGFSNSFFNISLI